MYILYYSSIFAQSALAVEELWLVHRAGKMLRLHIASLFASVFPNIQGVMFSQYFVTWDSYKTTIKKIKYFNKVYIYIMYYILYIYNTYNTYSNVTIYTILIYAYSSICSNIMNIHV